MLNLPRTQQKRDFQRPLIISRSSEPTCFFARLGVNQNEGCPALLQLLARGQTSESAYRGNAELNRTMAAMSGSNTLTGAVLASETPFSKEDHKTTAPANSENSPSVSKPKDLDTEELEFLEVTVFLRGFFKITQEEFIVIFSKEEFPALIDTPNTLVDFANHKLNEYNQAQNQYEDRKQREEAALDNTLNTLGPDALKTLDNMRGFYGDPAPRPFFLSEISQLKGINICSDIPESLLVNCTESQEALREHLLAEGFRLPRNGEIHVVSCIDPFAETEPVHNIAIWSEYRGGATYADIRWSLLEARSDALDLPLLEGVSRPEYPRQKLTITPFSSPTSDEDAFDTCRLDDQNYRERINACENRRQEHGFEAIGWYQTHHMWDEGSWGIYLDAEKIDDFALSIFDNLRSKSISNSMSTACFLAYGLVYSHEQFHARIDATLSWLELLFSSPKYREYKSDCYQKTLMTSACIEEALANWWSWQWFQNWLEVSPHPDSEREKLENIISAHLDLSPPGYADWRLGDDTQTARNLAFQLLSSRAPSPEELSKTVIESLIFGEPPFLFDESEIPLYWIGEGKISGAVGRSPSCLNTITRKEAERVLRMKECFIKGAGGKGSHQKWECPDNRTFQIPKGKDLSGKVFKHFLDFLGVDKSGYIAKYR